MQKTKYKPINLQADDHAEVDALRRKLIAKRESSKISLADTVMEGVRLLKEKTEAEK